MADHTELTKLPTTKLPRSLAAERMRRHRERRKNELRCLTIQIRESEIDALARKGFLQVDVRNETNSILVALYEFFERKLSSGRGDLMARPAYGAHTTCESCKSIDVRRWHREGLLADGQYFSCSWTYDGEPYGNIRVRTERDAVVLIYRARSWDATEWKSVEQRVPITWTACHLGGQRPWFVCSVYSDGRSCGRRVAILYGAGAYFTCRRCNGLAYASQQEAVRERGFIRARKILIRLGAKPDLFDPFPEKPARMHWCTYERLHRAYEIAKDRCFQGMLSRQAPPEPY